MAEIAFMVIVGKIAIGMGLTWLVLPGHYKRAIKQYINNI